MLLRLAPSDAQLRKLLGADVDLFGTHRPRLKDPGQREVCGCVFSKDIGMYNTCGHLCVYCYANTSRTAVKNTRARLADDPEVVVGGAH